MEYNIFLSIFFYGVYSFYYNYFNNLYCVLNNLFNIEYVQLYLLSGFLLHSSIFNHLQGTTYRNGIMVNTITIFISKMLFIMSLSSIVYNLDFIDYNRKYFEILLIQYLPFYLDYSEFIGESKMPMSYLPKKLMANIFKLFGNYTIINEHIDINGDNQCIIGIHPHGFFPFGTLGCCGLPIENHNFSNISAFLKANTNVGVASFCFYIPVLREIFLMLGGVDCSKPILDNLLKKGNSLSIFVGGAKEAEYSGYGKSTIILHERKGFFKLALENGITLIPSYTFGNNNIYTASSIDFFNICYYFKKLTGIWFPRGYFIPYKTNYITVFGEPIDVEQKVYGSYTDGDINRLKDKYIKNLVDVFNKYKILDKSVMNNKLLII